MINRINNAIYGVSFTHIHNIITRKKWKNAEQQIS